ncbi:PRC-barrel domain-containing protein [Mucilaginibacter sp. Bleaf8]|uniref:PRC-barrel domain-containing protein n=1 Tax=Mucilaginibacter sp. Bleaf8 TaxID=2834430 RepID=UPI001BCFA010|nr:PRC-barrel domain-containing protein [Mucilaginibacter sp. Bleaf8]MBS7565263.1 PRC-barrel domain-containing protein [Mucilaginibacter sp. Bleaf8]
MALEDNTTDYNHLEKLGGSDYEIVDGQPNIKGWDVKDERGMQFGDVEELLFNPASRKVRYIVLDTDANDFRLNARKVLVPIGIAELHENDDDVILPHVTASQLEALPDYDGYGLTLETENRIRTVFTPLPTTTVVTETVVPTTQDEAYYSHEQFNQNKLYNRRKLLPEHEQKRITERSTKYSDNDPNTDLP